MAKRVLEPIGISPAYTPLTCPSAQACTDVRYLVQQHECQLTAIQDHVAQLEACFADTESQQVHIQDTLFQPTTTLAPIRRLPPEILSEIFEHCLDDKNPAGLFSTSARHEEAPLLLGRVCRSWRAIAYASPRLWGDVFVNACDGRYSEALCADALPALQMWLAHSGSLPLRLAVLCKTERVLPGLVDLFGVIAEHAARWRTVHVRLQNAPVIHGLVARALARCTALETLDVTDGGQAALLFGVRQMREERPAGFDLSLAPLRQLSLSLAGLTMRNVRAPWATLTRLSFMRDARSSGTSITDYMAVLRQCVSLKECGIAIDSGVRDVQLDGVTLPSLECLLVQVLREASQTTQMGDFLSALRAPRLSVLSIEDCGPRRDPVLYHGQLKAFLGTHAASLRHLRYVTGSKWFESEDMVALIEETPLLTELEYRPDEESSPRDFLEALTPREEGEGVACLLPGLERLFVYWDTTETVTMVGDMVERRYVLAKRGITRLRYLSCKPVKTNVVLDRLPPYVLVENLSARLEPLCRCGLQVDWQAYRYNLEFVYC